MLSINSQLDNVFERCKFPNQTQLSVNSIIFYSRLRAFYDNNNFTRPPVIFLLEVKQKWISACYKW